MKKHIYITILIILSIAVKAVAQDFARWNFGVHTEVGRDWYHRDYTKMPKPLPNGYVEDFASKYSMAAGLFAERFFNPNLSALLQLTYLRKSMPPWVFGEFSGVASVDYVKEIQHRVIAETGARWYINPSSKLTFFVDGKVGAGRFVASDCYELSWGKFVITDAFGYNLLTPFYSASAGIRWKRLTLSGEFRQDMKPITRYYSATSITSRGFFGKVSISFLPRKLRGAKPRDPQPRNPEPRDPQPRV